MNKLIYGYIGKCKELNFCKIVVKVKIKNMEVVKNDKRWVFRNSSSISS